MNHAQEDFPARRKDLKGDGLCRVCLEAPAWEQLIKRLPEDKRRVCGAGQPGAGSHCHLSAQWDALQKTHKSTS